MILDAETLEPVAGVETLIRETEEPDAARAVEDRAARFCRRAEHRCARVGGRGDRSAARSFAPRPIGSPRARVAARRRRDASDGSARVAPGRAGRAVPLDAADGRLRGTAPGVNGLPRPRRRRERRRLYRALEAVLPWLPVVLALSANSPFLAGRRTGMQSNRAQILAELPRGGRRRRFAPTATGRRGSSVSSRSARSSTTRASGGTSARIRASARSRCGCPTSPRRSSAPRCWSGSIRQLVEQAEPRDHDPARRGDYVQNRWAAAHAGLDAELIHPDDDRQVTRARARARAARRRPAAARGNAPARARPRRGSRGHRRPHLSVAADARGLTRVRPRARPKSACPWRDPLPQRLR